MLGPTLVAWLPLVLLTVWRGDAQQSFFQDTSTQARLLLAIPLSLLVEPAISRRLGQALRHLVDTSVIDRDDQPEFQRILTAAMNLRDSPVVAGGLLLATYVRVWQLVVRALPEGAAHWMIDDHYRLSLAGWWYAVVSLPILVYLLVRWLWRVLLWSLVLLQLARLSLRLKPSHPDRTGGLAVLGRTQAVWALAVVPFSIVAGTVWHDQVLYRGVPERQFEVALAGYAATVLLLFLLPLCAFLPQLLRTKVDGLLRYDGLGSRYVSLFDQRWIGGEEGGRELLGTSDIQSLSDLANSYEVVRKMQVIPVGLNTIVAFGLAIIVPIAPFSGDARHVFSVVWTAFRSFF